MIPFRNNTFVLMHGVMAVEIRWAFNALAWKPNKQQLISALSSISKEENERVQKFVFKEDYKLCLVGRLLIRKCVHNILGIPWKKIKLTRSDKGKPELANNIQGRNFFFNISHQGDYTILAASTSVNIGVDIMKFTSPNNTDISSFFKLMKRQFADEEWKFIKSFDNEWNQLKAFYRMWCLKESFVKGLGVGIGTDSAEVMTFKINTQSLEDSRTCNDSTLYLRNIKQPWTFSECLLDDNHVVAVAMETPISNDNIINFEHIMFESLSKDLQCVLSPEEHWWDFYEQKYVK